jgi:tryptophanyl-tRNA synthetase
VLKQYAGAQFSAFKQDLSDLAVAVLGPIGAEMQRLVKDPGHVDRVLRDGAERANALAEPVLAEVERIVGWLKP